MKKIILIILIFFIIILLIIIKKKEIKHKIEEKICYNDIKLVQFALKEYLKDFHNTCEKYNIKYWADGGTLLGAVRENNIIDHDDDADICLFEDDFVKLVKIYENDPNYHIVPGNTDENYFINKFKIRGIDKVWIDIFIVEKLPNNIIRYKYKKHQQIWPDFYYKEEEVFPIVKTKFADFEINIPNNPIPYLERGYKDWKTPVVYKRHWL